MPDKQTIFTSFMPAEKAAPGEVERQNRLISGIPVLPQVLNGILGSSLILNEQRQAVFISLSLAAFLTEHELPLKLGFRPGNLFGCLHSAESEGGCGTTEACRHCGSAGVVHDALEKTDSVQECRILSSKSGGAGLEPNSIRLLSERYLKGRVACTVDVSGTLFTAEFPSLQPL